MIDKIKNWYYSLKYRMSDMLEEYKDDFAENAIVGTAVTALLVFVVFVLYMLFTHINWYGIVEYAPMILKYILFIVIGAICVYIIFKLFCCIMSLIGMTFFYIVDFFTHRHNSEEDED